MATNNRYEYQLINKEGEERYTPTDKYNAFLGRKTVALIGAVVGATALMVMLYFTGLAAPPTVCPTVKPRQYWLPSCGHNPDEAKAAGCIFDPMMNSWTHPDCYDEELSMEFRSLRDWKFYKDQNATILLSDEEFSRAGSAWGSWEYHIAHCMFSFRKLHKAILHEGKIEREVGSEPHTDHCLMVTNVTFGLMQKARANGEDFSLQDMGTVLNTGYHRCFDAINLLPYDGVVTY